ncbi:PspA/IM30 family protein [Tengunoibacter tsumagoiensis]|uniref:Membrane protein n=1 Tax=Tengunoibacter tsumagoiensis TaxID=2014871 RepID=A0A402A2N9_9CHLR|nr:PspA/IM30 family protein [Tengunoibacter tsumagoiensis]GCE13394.1 membrane protein [Tengunoibacter tsumagoiensis]
MNLLERVLTLLRANLTTVVETADDPEKVLRQLQLDMRNQLVQVKTQVATAIAESHKLQKRSQERKTQADGWLRKAEQAVQQGNDDVARDALTHYNDTNKQMQRYLQQKQEQESLVSTMRNALRQLEAKIAEVDTTIDILATRKRNALIQQRVFDALNKTGNRKDREATTKAQDAVIEAEARARALADLHSRSLDAQLTQLTREQMVENQLQHLKSQKPAQSPLNMQQIVQNAKKPHTGPLSTQPLSEDQADPSTKRDPSRIRQAHIPSEPSTQQDIQLKHLKKLLDTPQSMDS